MPEHPRNEEKIFAIAIELPTAEVRALYLQQVCGNDDELLQRVTALLHRHEESQGPLDDSPAVEPTVDVPADASKEHEADSGNGSQSVLHALGRHLATVPRVRLLPDDPTGSESAADSGSEQTPENGERYQFSEEIARGGMGAILRGHDADLGRELAVKVLLETHQDRPEVVERFIEEAQIGGQLQHPGIVPVYELGRFSDRRPFFTMKLVKGKTLAELLAQRGDVEVDLSKFLGIFDQVCQTMAYAHSRGVIHRDLKPANVMVGAFGEVQVMDWGLAKVLSRAPLGRPLPATPSDRDEGEGSPQSKHSSATRAGSIMGTPAYMPPEQAQGRVDELDERVDVFGLGAILCEILTGKPPYVGSNSSDILEHAANGNLGHCMARLSDSGSDRELVEVARRTLAVDPEERPNNARAVADAITKYLNGVQQRLKESELATAKAQAKRKLYFAIAMLMVFIAVGSVLMAQRLRQLLAETERQLTISTVTALAAQSEAIRDVAPTRSLLLAVEAVEHTRRKGEPVLPVAQETLLAATPVVGGTPLIHSAREVDAGVFSPDGRHLFTSSRDGTVYVWDVSGGVPPTAPTQILQGHQGDVAEYAMEANYAMAISANGRWLTTGNPDSTAVVWDLDAPELAESAMTFQGHGGKVMGVAVSDDGHWLATASTDQTARLWDLTADDPTASSIVLEGHRDEVWSVAFSPDGRWLGTGSKDATARLWDLQSPDMNSTFTELLGHTENFVLGKFSPNGWWFVTASIDRTARLWDMRAEEPSRSPVVLQGTAMMDYVVFSPDNRWLATGSGDGRTRLWDLTAEDPAASDTELSGHTHHVWTLAFSSSGRWLATAGWDKTIRLWDMRAEDPLSNPLVMRGHDETIVFVAISPDEQWVASGGFDGARLWRLNADAPSNSPLVLRGNSERVNATSTTPDGRWLVTSSADGTTQVWDMRLEGDASLIKVLQNTGVGQQKTIALSPDGRRLVTGSQDATVRLWDMTGDDPASSSLDLIGHSERLVSAAISGDSRWLVTGSADQSARVWDMGAADPGSSSLELPGHPHPVNRVAIGPHGRWVVTASGDLTPSVRPNSDTQLRLWDTRAQDPRQAVQILDNKVPVTHLTISPDGRYLAVGGSYVARLWDLTATPFEPSTSIALRGHKSVVDGLIFSPDNRKLFVSTWGAETRIWDLTQADLAASSPELLPTAAMAISSDGRWLVGGSSDFTLSVIDLFAPDPASSSFQLRGHSRQVGRAAISPDNRWIVTGGWDATARLWQLDLDELIGRARRSAGRQLTPEERKAYLLSR